MIMILYPTLREEVQIRLVSLQRFLPLEYSEHTDLLRAHVKGCDVNNAFKGLNRLAVVPEVDNERMSY